MVVFSYVHLVTEPLIRVMAEGPDQKELEEICYKIADVVKVQQG